LDEIRRQFGTTALSLHFHDTYGMAVANVLTAWTEYGIASFDTSAGGLGGCPYAPGASGNVATEDVVYALRASGASVNVDEGAVLKAVRRLGQTLNRPLSSRLSQLNQHDGTYEAVR
jgi:hydroxymethylglutaryl-CoA lyase